MKINIKIYWKCHTAYTIGLSETYNFQENKINVVDLYCQSLYCLLFWQNHNDDTWSHPFYLSWLIIKSNELWALTPLFKPDYSLDDMEWWELSDVGCFTTQIQLGSKTSWCFFYILDDSSPEHLSSINWMIGCCNKWNDTIFLHK